MAWETTTPCLDNNTMKNLVIIWLGDSPVDGRWPWVEDRDWTAETDVFGGAGMAAAAVHGESPVRKVRG